MGFQEVSDSFITEHQVLHQNDFAVSLLVEVLLLSVEVVQFLVPWLNEQLEMLQTFLVISVSPEPILSSAAVVQRIFDLVVA